MTNFVKFPISLYFKDDKVHKQPTIKEWSKLKASVPCSETSYGIVCGEASNLLVIDLDKNKQDEIDGTVLLEKFKIDTFTVKTQSGGIHLYFKYNQKLAHKTTREGILKVSGKTVAIDIRGTGGFVVGAGSMLAVNNEIRKYDIINSAPIIDMPEYLIDMINAKDLNEDWKPIKHNNVLKVSNQVQNTENLEQDIYNQLDYKLSLLKLNRFNDYDTWVSIGMVIFNLTNNIDLWHKYSKLSEKYNPEELIKKWKSFKSDTEKKYQWNYINNLMREDHPENYKSIGKIERVILNEMYNLRYYEEKYNSLRGIFAKTLKKRTEEEKKQCIELQKEFSKHFFINVESTPEIYYARLLPTFEKAEETKTYIFSLPLIDFKKGLSNLCLENLFNPTYVLKVNASTIHPSMPTIYYDEKTKLILYNNYIKPEYNLKRLQKWISENKNIEIMNKVNSWLEFHFFNIICRENKEDYEYICDWIANTLFDAEFFPGTSLVLMSAETGTGKTGPIKKIFQEYFGAAWGFKDDSQFAGNGAKTPLIGKSFALLDELEIKTSEDYNQFKSMVTGHQIEVKEMHKNKKIVANWCKFIGTANKYNPIANKETNERRIVEFNLKSYLSHKKENYFDILNEPWQYFTNFFVQFFERAAKRKNWIHKTAVNTNNAKIKMDPVEQFITNNVIGVYYDFPTNNEEPQIEVTELYKLYAAECNDKNKTLFLTRMKEKNVIQDETAITKRLSNGKRIMAITLTKLEDIIHSFKKRNSNIDPCEGWHFCKCGNKALYRKEEINQDMYYCEKHKKLDVELIDY